MVRKKPFEIGRSVSDPTCGEGKRVRRIGQEEEEKRSSVLSSSVKGKGELSV